MQDGELEALRQTISALQAQRAVLGDTLVDGALAPLLERLTALDAPTAASEPPRRLRQVSVLFLDIVGSTQLIQHLEPEDVQSVVDGALTAFSEMVRQHGGEVLRYAGDSLKAAFGADRSREDDAERAVLCGLALLQEARRRGQALQRVHGLDGFDARVGIHTGAVVRGGGVEQSHSLSGLAVHVAARMEQAAPAGALRISVDTYRLVQERFDVQELPPLAVKGLTEPMRSFLVEGARERRLQGPRRGVEGLATALVGRSDELAGLRAAAQTVTAPGGSLAAVTLVGDAGLGKSRLLEEALAAWPASVRPAQLWRASSHPQAMFQPCGLLRDLLFWRLGVRDSHSQAEAQQIFAAALAPLFGEAAEEHTALLGQLIGLDYSASPVIAGILRDGPQLRARGLHAWVRTLVLQADGDPIVLVLDDLQWADEESLQALDHLATAAADQPVLLLCAARPELLQRRPRWGATWPAHTLVSLQPLAGPGSDALAAALLSRCAAPPPALHALLQAQAAGNPYYMEALLQMLVDTGVVRVEADTWQVQADRLHNLKVPPTLVGVLQATLDALEDGERRSLQQASVVGALFWDEALAAIDEQAPAQLPGLSERALTLPQAESAFQGAHAYQFRHHLLHQVTYGTVLKTDRRQAHARAARWLQSRSHGREQELAGQIAEHFERAGEAEPATAYWLAAAEHAARRQSDLAAVAHADRALALMDRAGGLIDAAPVDVGQDTRRPDPALDRERRLRLHRVRCDVFLRGGDAERHDREIAVLETLAEPGGDEDLRLAYDHAWRLSNDGRYADAAALIEERLSRADEATRRRAGRLNGMLFVCLVHTGREDDALAHADRSLAAARADGDLSSVGALHNNLGVTHMQASRVDLTISHYRQALEAYQTTGNRQGQVTVRMNLAQVELMRGHYAAASELLQDSLGVSRGIGSRRLEAMVCANLSVCLSALEEPQAAYDTALEGIRLSRLAGETRTEAWGHNGAETAAGLLGRHTEALAHACAARDGFRTHHDAATAWTHAAAAVRHLQALGRIEEARTEADALLAEVEAQGGWGGGYEGAYNLYVALAPLGDARAPGLLACAHEALCLQADRLAAHVEREAYLRCHAVHRSIVAAWAAMQSGSDRARP